MKSEQSTEVNVGGALTKTCLLLLTLLLSPFVKILVSTSSK